MQVLGARGSELERSFSYGVVRQLFEPLLASLPAEERAELLSGAAGLAAPLFDPVRARGRAGRRFVVGDAARPLLAGGEPGRPRAAAAGARRPALVRPALAALAGLPAAADGGARRLGGRRSPARGAGSGPGPAGPDRLRPARDRRSARSAEPGGRRPAPARDLARCRRRLLRRLPRGDGRQSAAPARARARDRRRGSGPDRGARASPARARGAGRLAHRLACAFPASRRRRRGWRGRWRSWATTPIRGRRPRSPTWRTRPPPRRLSRSPGSTSCARSRRSGSCIR